eukprot:151118-Chlamydomonas_euryale.AAC.1
MPGGDAAAAGAPDAVSVHAPFAACVRPGPYLGTLVVQPLQASSSGGGGGGGGAGGGVGTCCGSGGSGGGIARRLTPEEYLAYVAVPAVVQAGPAGTERASNAGVTAATAAAA